MDVSITKGKERGLLTPRREPYWARLREGCYLGYRVSHKGGEGTWLARFRDPDGKQKYRALGTFVDGKRIAGPTPLADGATITFGSERVTFRQWSDEEAAGTEPVGR